MGNRIAISFLFFTALFLLLLAYFLPQSQSMNMAAEEVRNSSDLKNGEKTMDKDMEKTEKPEAGEKDVKWDKMSDKEWREKLDENSFCILRQKATERAFSGKYYNNHDEGVYKCAGCGQVLFTSDNKFDSGSGWPSYFSPASKDAIAEVRDTSHGMIRTEVVCSRCKGHLGHVFHDGPPPTGLRYCINSAALKFEKKSDMKDEARAEGKTAEKIEAAPKDEE